MLICKSKLRLFVEKLRIGIAAVKALVLIKELTLFCVNTVCHAMHTEQKNSNFASNYRT